ncbi:unnamed protein product [Didymodactylos carnosus]|uniref:Uncharacterized protein n=1 Tax=Didymodactylos carnosus TaxID=1234261 RepID=A0A816AQ44_9BILA|nr:unnamed protein product [Didymodactylos carnosus]CAF1598454.1 unnamed protein product [Didymodactylos carnosus]CAF4206769.1 unnamed protein product [Didymodactylos carnosus]CAF4474393.1 unnamed protein product [Didymodactylos carnosus]
MCCGTAPCCNCCGMANCGFNFTGILEALSSSTTPSVLVTATPTTIQMSPVTKSTTVPTICLMCCGPPPCCNTCGLNLINS